MEKRQEPSVGSVGPIRPPKEDELKQAISAEESVPKMRGSRMVYDNHMVRRSTGTGIEKVPNTQPHAQRAAQAQPAQSNDVPRNQVFTTSSGKTLANFESQTDPIDMTDFYQADLTEKPPAESVLAASPRNIHSTPISEEYLNMLAERKLIQEKEDKRNNTTAFPESPPRQSVGSQLESPSIPSIGRHMTVAQRDNKKFKSFKEQLRYLWSVSHTIQAHHSSSSEDEAFHAQQRDTEWLEFTSSESGKDVLLEVHENKFESRNSKLEPQAEELHQATRGLSWLLQLGGRIPVQSFVKDQTVKYRLRTFSFAYISFLVTSLFLIYCTVMIFYTMLEIFQYSEFTTSFVIQAEKLDVNKYKFYMIVTLCYLVIGSLWSLAALFQDAHSLADYLTRWISVQVELKHYGDYAGVRSIIFWSTVSYFLYATALVGIFFWSSSTRGDPNVGIVPAIRGTSGLLGLCVLKPFVHNIRFKAYFWIVRLCGLFIHLYAVYAARMVTLTAIVYCKIIENMARKWNLRVAYALGMLGRQKTEEKSVTYISEVPLTKLFAEHKLIVFLQKYTGQVFSVVLMDTSYARYWVELIALLYHTLSLLVFPLPSMEDKFVEKMPNNEFVPYTDSNNNVVMTAACFTLYNFMGWFITSERLQTSGYCIMCGYNFIRRYGLVRCMTSKERRFILSMQCSFAPGTDYFLHPGCKINRKFIFEMFFWVCTITSLLIAFNPIKLEKDLITVCENDKCIRLRVPKTFFLIGSSRGEEVQKLKEKFDEKIKEVAENSGMGEMIPPSPEEPITLPELMSTTTLTITISLATTPSSSITPSITTKPSTTSEASTTPTTEPSTTTNITTTAKPSTTNATSAATTSSTAINSTTSAQSSTTTPTMPPTTNATTTTLKTTSKRTAAPTTTKRGVIPIG